jgi:hypothetical protein
MSTPLNSVYSGFSTGSGIQRYLIEAPAVHTGGSDSTVSTGSSAGTSSSSSTTGLTVTDGTSSVIGAISADSTALKIQASAGKAISLLNGSAEAVRISSAGKVSLGTTPDEENLSVLGNVNVNGFIKGLGIYDTSMVKGGGDSIPVVQCNSADLNSGQNVLWQHTTNQVPPTKSLLYIESKGVATTPSYERLIIGADRAGTRVLNLNPGGKVAVGGDYAMSEVTSTLDVGGAMTVRGSILPDDTTTRNIGSSTLKFSSIYGSNIVDTIATRGSGSTIPFSISTGVGLNSGQNVLWSHTTNEATPTNAQLLIETKGVNSTNPAVERFQIGSYRDGYRNIHLQPAGRVMIGGDYSATAVSSTLDVGGTMTVRGNILPEATNTRDIGTSGLTFNGVYCNGLIQPSTSNAMTFNVNSAERLRINSNGVSTFRGDVLPYAAGLTLGNATVRWTELYCTNNVINTSDLNEKTAIVPLAPADSLTTLLKLHPVSYKWKENSHDRYHTGFISQQVEEDVGVDVAHDWGFFIKSPGLAEDMLDEEGKVVDVIQHPDTYGLRYTELISPLVGAVQCLAQRVESLESAGENKRKQYEVLLEEQRTAMVQYQQEITSLNDRLAVIENALKTMEFIN